ncbi:MAG: hypothetical protein ACO2ZK_14005, partial [Gemmobacter sp.]
MATFWGMGRGRGMPPPPAAIGQFRAPKRLAVITALPGRHIGPDVLFGFAAELLAERVVAPPAGAENQL